MILGLFVKYKEDSGHTIEKPRKLIINPREYLRREGENIKDLVEMDDSTWLFKFKDQSDETDIQILRPIFPSYMEVELNSYDSKFDL